LLRLAAEVEEADSWVVPHLWTIDQVAADEIHIEPLCRKGGG
jgi:hypothetical protein